MIYRSRFETKVLTAFTAAVLVVAGITSVTWKVEKDAADAARWVAHTQEVLNSISNARGDALQIELSTQNYRLYGNPAALDERNATIAAREISLQRIKALTADNVRQQERWTKLRAVVDERLAISRRVEQLRKTESVQAANAYAASAPLKETRDRMHQLLHAMEQEERSLLANRIAEHSRARHTFITAGTAVALLLAALLATIYVLIRRQLQETEASRHALAESEERLAITLQSIGDAVLATDTAGRITRMNPVAEQLTGWQFSDAQGRSIDDVFCVIDEQTRTSAESSVSKVLETGAVQGMTEHAVLVARTGKEYWIASSAAPILNATGRLIGVVLVFHDETVARQAQRAISEQNELLEQRVRERTAQLRESEDHLRSVINNVPALIAFVNSEQRYIYVNQQYRERFAPGREDITGCTVRDILGEERYAIAASLIDKVLKGQPQSYDWQPFPGVWQVINYVPRLDAQDRVLGYYVLGTDITMRKLSEEKIQTLNADLEHHIHELEHVTRALKTLSAGNRTMLRATAEQDLLDGMCGAIIDAGGYHSASVWYRNDDECCAVRPVAQSGHPGGIGALEAIASRWNDDEHGRGVVAVAMRTGRPSVVRNILTDPVYAAWRPHLPGYACGLACPLQVGSKVIGALAIYAGEPDSFSPDEVALLTESADDLAFGISTLRARVEQQRTQDAMRRLTFFDDLTGLPNETQFSELIIAAIDTGTQESKPFAVLQINIERLSEVNDTLGFNHGDQLLRDFGERLKIAAQPPATVARLRGDEFAILLPDGTVNAAIRMVQHLETLLAAPFPIADLALDVSAKIGVTLFPEHGTTPHDLFRHMDIAVQRAKKQGVGHVIFDPAHSQGQAGRLTMVGELRRAIEGGNLLLYLQPKVDMLTGRVCGAEGLVRWGHAERGVIQPSEFIGLAEHTGLIKPLTEWMIEKALHLNQDWAQRGGALPIAINVSTRSLRDEKLLEKIRQMRATMKFGADLLEMEITESMVMDDAAFALRVLRELRDDGIALYIDDFGTGYSSLSYLQKLPVDYIKIDQSFVSDMLVSKDSSRIVQSTIDLAHDLGRKVVAEGVETQAHWDLLAAFGCDIAQGYFIAGPMPPEEFANWREHFCAPETITHSKA